MHTNCKLTVAIAYTVSIAPCTVYLKTKGIKTAVFWNKHCL